MCMLKKEGNEDVIKHPSICFGISRHNVIIPLKVTDVIDCDDGCFKYEFEINHPSPSRYMECHYRADFKVRIVSEDSPLFYDHSNIRLTLEEAGEFIAKQLKSERDDAVMKIESIDKSIEKIGSEIALLELAIGKQVI